MKLKSLLTAIAILLSTSNLFAATLSCGEQALENARAAAKQVCTDSPFKCSDDEDIYYSHLAYDKSLCRDLPSCEAKESEAAAKTMYANDCSYF